MVAMRVWAKGIGVGAAAVLLYLSAPAPASAQDCNCDNPTTRVCTQFCKRLECLPGTTQPSFIQTKDCAPKKNVPAHQVERICCTGGTVARPRIRCRNYPRCNVLSSS